VAPTWEQTKVEDASASGAVASASITMSLGLPTPAQFPAFPYSPPYKIQIDLMRHLYASIEQSKVTIVESPTGTVSPALNASNTQPTTDLCREKHSVCSVQV